MRNGMKAILAAALMSATLLSAVLTSSLAYGQDGRKELRLLRCEDDGKRITCDWLVQKD